jgi:hypothetical protein
MAHKLAVDELDLPERTLPLEDLSGIQAGDALRIEWPAASVVIGNPPFHGDRHLRGLLGDDYVKWLEQTFNCGIKDYCVYWFRKTHEHLRPGQRAGLVGTNSITQNRARPASVGHVLDAGGQIANAVSSQDWPGAANVDVSIVNWVKEPPEPIAHPVLDGDPLDEPIAASLRPRRYAVERAHPLTLNDGRSFFGCLPGDLGFLLESDEAAALLEGKHLAWRDLIRPYLIGNDLTKDPEQRPSRWVIDFGHRTLEQAMQFPEALELVRQRVKPDRDKVRRPGYRRYWWRFKEPLTAMRKAIEPFERYIASPAQAKRIQFSWVGKHVCPSNLVTVFAFEDDYAMGVISAFAHHSWLTAGWSTLARATRPAPSSPPTRGRRSRHRLSGRP